MSNEFKEKVRQIKSLANELLNNLEKEDDLYKHKSKASWFLFEIKIQADKLLKI